MNENYTMNKYFQMKLMKNVPNDIIRELKFTYGRSYNNSIVNITINPYNVDSNNYSPIAKWLMDNGAIKGETVLLKLYW